MSDRWVEVAISKDGGRNYGTWRKMSLGELGNYKQRVAMRALGTGYNWRFKIRVSSPIKRDLLGAVGVITLLDA